MSADPLVGSVVAGKYRVTEGVARGGMGRIYRAVQEPLGRPVALKILTPPVLGTDHDFSSLQKRFLLEAATCARLRHPNTVSVYDYGALEVAGSPTLFMIMEFVEGRTLSQTLRASGPLAAGRVVRIMHEIARSLREAHAAGVVHRDLKPSNVMLTQSEEGEGVKVLDFGVAKVLSAGTEALTTDGSFVGSPRYTAPEQIRQEDVDGRADLYALGVVAWELLTGSAPFSSPEPMRTLLMQLNDPLPAFTPAHPVPPGLEALIRRLLEKDPAARLPDAGALITELRAIKPDLHDATVELAVPVDAITASTTEMEAPPRREGGVVLALGVGALFAVLLLVGVAGAAVWWVQANRAPAPPPVVVAPEVVEPKGLPAGAEVLATPSLAVVTVRSSPSGAEVWVDGVRRGETPMTLEYDPEATRSAPLTVQLRKAAHKPAEIKLSGPDDDGEVALTLSSLRRPESGKAPVVPPPSDDIRLER